MPEPEDDLVEIPEEIREITREEAEENPGLRSDPSSSTEGVLDGEDPSFETRELEATEELLAEGDDEAGDAAPQISGHQRNALKLALTQKGPRETPPGSNRNIYSAYFGFGPQFWCADFVAWALDKTGDRDKKVAWGYPSAVKNIT